MLIVEGCLCIEEKYSSRRGDLVKELDLGLGNITVCVKVWLWFGNKTWFGGDEDTTTSANVSRAIFTYDSHSKSWEGKFSGDDVGSQPCLGAYYNVWLI